MKKSSPVKLISSAPEDTLPVSLYVRVGSSVWIIPVDTVFLSLSSISPFRCSHPLYSLRHFLIIKRLIWRTIDILCLYHWLPLRTWITLRMIRGSNQDIHPVYWNWKKCIIWIVHYFWTIELIQDENVIKYKAKIDGKRWEGNSKIILANVEKYPFSYNRKVTIKLVVV